MIFNELYEKMTVGNHTKKCIFRTEPQEALEKLFVLSKLGYAAG